MATEKEKKKAKPGYVYFIYMPEKYETGDHLVKIGITKNEISIRLHQLQTGNPYALKAYKTLLRDDYKVIEQDLHKKYANNNKLNEWFHITLEEVDKIIESYTVEPKNEKKDKKPKKVEEEITVEEPMDKSRKIYATSKNWLKDKWTDDPEGTKEKWCSDKIKKAISKHMATDEESWKTNDLKSLAEFRFFYETYCAAKSPSLDKKLADSIRVAWRKEKEIVEFQISNQKFDLPNVETSKPTEKKRDSESFKFVYTQAIPKKEEEKSTWSKFKGALKWLHLIR